MLFSKHGPWTSVYREPVLAAVLAVDRPIRIVLKFSVAHADVYITDGGWRN